MAFRNMYPAMVVCFLVPHFSSWVSYLSGFGRGNNQRCVFDRSVRSFKSSSRSHDGFPVSLSYSSGRPDVTSEEG